MLPSHNSRTCNLLQRAAARRQPQQLNARLVRKVQASKPRQQTAATRRKQSSHALGAHMHHGSTHACAHVRTRACSHVRTCACSHARTHAQQAASSPSARSSWDGWQSYLLKLFVSCNNANAKPLPIRTASTKAKSVLAKGALMDV